MAFQSDTFQNDAFQTPEGETYSQDTINSENGGSLTLNTLEENNFAEITLPPNYYTETLTLQCTSYSNTFYAITNPAPSGERFTGKTYDFSLFTSEGVRVTETSKLITIILYYSDANVSGIQENTLAPYRWDNDSWHLIQGYVLDMINNTITFSTTSFSPFCVFGSPFVVKGGGIYPLFPKKHIVNQVYLWYNKQWNPKSLYVYHNGRFEIKPIYYWKNLWKEI